MQATNVWDINATVMFNATLVSHMYSPEGTGELSQQRSMAVVFGIFVAVHVVFGTIGNVMVIVAIRQSRRLQSKSDYLIGSLAVADLLVSAIVVPFAACVVFQEEDPSSFPWINSIFCGVFIFLDVSCCTVSILHLCAIAWVRYQSVTNIRNAFKTVSLRSVLPLVPCLWALASVLSIMPFLIFGSMTNTNSTTRDIGNSSTSDASDSLHCHVVTNKVYRVIATTVAFYAPLLVILIIYTKMAKIAWAKARERGIHSSQKKKHRKKGTAQGESITNSKTKQCKGVGNDAMVCLRSPEAQNTITGAETPSSCSVPEYCSEADTIESSCGTNETSSVRVRLKRERRILLTLGMIIGAFIVCWLPFFVKEIVIAFCSCSIPPLVEVIINWLGYINSVLNPVIYAYTNKDFNDAFRKMWCRKR